MNNTLFFIILISLVVVICLYETASNKNKFRAKLLVDGFINKLVILAFIVLLIMEDIRLGIILLFGFFMVHIGLKNNESNVIEGFQDYFSSKF
jgi:hypothetical protein